MIAEATPAVDVSQLTAETLVFDNPILVKHVRSRLRQPVLVPVLIVTLILASLTIWACFKLGAVNNGIAFAIITAAQCAILYLSGSMQVATAIADARSSGILDFHRVSPVRSVALTVGFTLGAAIRDWVLFAALIPFSLACVGGGNPDAIGWLKSMSAIIVAGLLYHTFAAVIGATARQRTAGGAAVLLAIVLFSIPSTSPVLTCVAATHLYPELPLQARFFALRLPHYVIGMLHQLPLLAFVFVAAVRKIRREQARVYARKTAILLFAVVGFFVLADSYYWWLRADVPSELPPIVAAYIMGFIGLVLAAVVCPGWGDFANGIRRARKLGRKRPSPMDDFASNLTPVAALSAITLAVPLLSVALSHGHHEIRIPALKSAFVAAATVLYFGCALQTFSLRFRRNATVYLALFLFLCWIVPLLLAMVAGMTNAEEAIGMTCLAFSPLASVTFGGIMQTSDFVTTPMPWLVWIVLGVPAALAAIFVYLSITASANAESEAVRTR